MEESRRGKTITMKKYTIKVTVLLENSFWVGLFERNDKDHAIMELFAFFIRDKKIKL